MGIIFGLIVTVAIVVLIVWVSRPKEDRSDFSFETKANPTADCPITVSFKYESDPYDDLDEDRDSWEGGFWEASDPKKLTAQFQIEYTDGKGSSTTRTVDVRQFDNALYGGMMMGFCRLREETRTFRFDRIQSCVDVESGEIIEDVRGYLNQAYENSPDRLGELLLEDYLDVLKVLCFVAKADGRFDKKEKEVISEYLKKLIRDERISVTIVTNSINGLGKIPTLQGYKMALGRAIKGGWVDPALLQQCCHDIVDTQTTIHPAEQDALDYLDRRIATFVKETAGTAVGAGQS